MSTETTTDRRPRFEVYEDNAGEYRWRFVAGNGEIVADSGQGYASERNAREGIAVLKNHAAGAPIQEADDGE